ncbi:hypothetical protein BHM03_00048480 [Ensete ventricosum]|nr:hypothetical protein BHM03_00048480 [Ensete ventricosum]
MPLTLLESRWAAIASYLPERTDNDIKNYWNTHLKKKLRKLGTGNDRQTRSRQPSYRSISKGQWERCLQTDIHMAKRALSEALSMENSDDLPDSMASSAEYSFNIKPSTYASSTENISRLLEGWLRGSPKPGVASASSTSGGSMSPEPLESMFGINESTAETRTPLSLLESWLLDESVGHGQESLLDMATGDDACDQFLF